MAIQLTPGDPGAFYFPVETTNGRWYIVVVLVCEYTHEST